MKQLKNIRKRTCKIALFQILQALFHPFPKGLYAGLLSLVHLAVPFGGKPCKCQMLQSFLIFLIDAAAAEGLYLLQILQKRLLIHIRPVYLTAECKRSLYFRPPAFHKPSCKIQKEFHPSAPIQIFLTFRTISLHTPFQPPPGIGVADRKLIKL